MRVLNNPFGQRQVNVLEPFRPPVDEPLVPLGYRLKHPPAEERRPHDSPDFCSEAVSFLVSALSLKESAATMANKTAAQRIIAEADSAISALIDDDICPRWPKPGPPPPWWLVSQIAAEVTFVANNLAQGALRTALTQVGSRILEEFVQRNQADFQKLSMSATS
jgi:hypothetical protein